MPTSVPLDPADPWAPEILRRLLDRLHALCEWETELSYHDGYAAGYAAANADLVATLRSALGGPHAQTWKQAVDVHHRTITARRLRAEADAPGPRPGDYTGGPVSFDPRPATREEVSSLDRQRI